MQNGVQPSVKPNTPNPTPKKAKNKNKSHKVIGKTVGNFKCTSDSCGKSWSSVHAWTSERFFCELCNSKAKVLNFVDEVTISK